VDVDDLKQSVTDLGMALATAHAPLAAPIRLLPTPPPSPPASPGRSVASPRAHSVVVVSATTAKTIPSGPAMQPWRLARAPRTPRRPPTPPSTSRCLYVANERGPDGKWYFAAGKSGWRSTLTRQIGGSGRLLAGVELVTSSRDTRLCLACPDR
jgi:hypothetical protein